MEYTGSMRNWPGIAEVVLVFILFNSNSSHADSSYTDNCPSKYVSGAGMRLRANPSSSSKILKNLRYGELACVSETKGEWTQVSVRDLGESGWLMSQSLTSERPLLADTIKKAESSLQEKSCCYPNILAAVSDSNSKIGNPGC